MAARKLVAVAFIVAGLLATPAAAAHADTTKTALFGPNGGWAQARNGNRTTIGVVNAPWLKVGMDYWNKLAGWNMLAFSSTPQITAKVDRTCLYCALATSTTGVVGAWASPFGSCNVSIARDSRRNARLIAHELGHCIGLQHQLTGVMKPSNAATLPTSFAAFDQSLMVNAGYAATT